MRWKNQVDNLDLVRDETGLGVNRCLLAGKKCLSLERDGAAALSCSQSLR
jgi:hypothetical protein